ncbi:hypothetical protein VTN96DRAFT_7345 [Rasamsonia emersonii]|uniref:Uncharacterized protein n=1 Tax=Rasamsonia emersonii (strain ATCC 16479 / CBS 393.64 / IMI 116815) TaxID=1408163 RepID=A0A0F4Z2V0_RASE3|nr:hypothetical protein T310_1737 [Rasamsonia emersonii CBS 393.64]KKA24198.1 hypothetical protein T310_1737 [Rasamsonia emersonii CBS 393.64]
MKSFTIATTTTIILAIGAMARNCTPGLNYCGSTLLDIGHYQSQIDQAIADAGVPEVDNGRESLFHCIGGDNGVIKYLGDCPNGCHDAGAGNSDYCVGQE